MCPGPHDTTDTDDRYGNSLRGRRRLRLLGGAAQEEPGKAAKELRQLDALGRLNLASGFARVGGFFEAAD